MPHPPVDPPLAGVRVLDLADGQYQRIGHHLAELGAYVDRLEPVDSVALRHRGLEPDGTAREVTLAGKVAQTFDLSAPGAWAELVVRAQNAEIVLVSADSAFFGTGIFGREVARRALPATVVVVLSEFGLTGPKRDWLATPAVHLALATVLSRSGLPEFDEPLPPPEFLAHGASVPQALWATMLAYFNSTRTGVGDHVDFSTHEGLVHVLDPAVGMGGSARAGESLRNLPRGRPDARHLYPIFEVSDGRVRICVLSPRQWRAMWTWLGAPEEFADPRFEVMNERFAAADRLYPLIAKLLSRLTGTEAVDEGQARGVPVACMASVGDALQQPAFWDAGSFTRVKLSDGRSVTVPTGVYELDGVRLTTHSEGTHLPPPPGVVREQRTVVGSGRPFEGLRVLDLGVIVVGAELGRLFADYGADVIKIESRSAPDGARQSPGGASMTEGVSWGHRNKRSLGLNLKSAEGQRIFAQLVASADVVLTNFKAGTMESLGFGFDRLASINPGIIVSESSAFGNVGPWSQRLGYGPLVRASSGLSGLWRYPGVEDSYSDAITIYPDHVVARFNAAAVTALLIRRARTGRGGRISTAQVDVIFAAMSDELTRESLNPGTNVPATASDAPVGLFPCAGDDEWIMIDGAGDDRFARLAVVTGRQDWLADESLSTSEGRVAQAERLRTDVRAWTLENSALVAERVLQAAGVPAGHMARIDDLLADAHLRSRNTFGELHQPQFTDPLPTLLGEAVFDRIEIPALRPAPELAEHTVEVLPEILGLDRDTVIELQETGAVETAKVTATPAPARQ